MSAALEKTLERFSFGDSPEMADALLALVLSGRKTATCGPLYEYEQEGATLPQPGERSIVLNGANKPAGVIETTHVAVLPFNTVDAEFARAEGEGDLSLMDWRATHEAFFRKFGGFTPEMMLVCRTFRLIERLDAEQVRA